MNTQHELEGAIKAYEDAKHQRLGDAAPLYRNLVRINNRKLAEEFPEIEAESNNIPKSVVAIALISGLLWAYIALKAWGLV